VLKYPTGFNVTNSTEVAIALTSYSSAYPRTSSTSIAFYLRTTHTAVVRDVNYSPYAINNVRDTLRRSAISPNATHADCTIEYDMYSL
jgi:alpha-glucosidase